MSTDEDIKLRFKANITHFIALSGLSQSDIAEALGVSIPQANRLINAKAQPTIGTIAKLSKALSIPPWFLIWAPIARERVVYDFAGFKYSEVQLESFLKSLAAFQDANFLLSSEVTTAKTKKKSKRKK